MLPGKRIVFDRPFVMGVINRSPNSFFAPCMSDAVALAQAESMIKEGADILDIGGEATNPFVDIAVESPDAENERDRVIPLIKQLRQRHPQLLLSVDTSSPLVMQAAIDAGVDIINDQRALARPGALELVANSDVAVCLMHWLGPERLPGSSSAAELLQRIIDDLSDRVAECERAGIAKQRIILDPGFGGGNFGKDTQENCYIMRHLDQLQQLQLPLLVGWSRKSMLGELLDAPIDERLYGSIAAATLAATAGVQIIRVHDVKPSVDAVKVACALS